MDTSTILLPHVFDAAACGAVHTALIEDLLAHHTIRLDAQHIERVGTPAIQWLLTVLQYGGGKVSLVQPSPTLESAFADLGLGHVLKGVAA